MEEATKLYTNDKVTNSVELVGMIADDFIFSHSCEGESFYSSKIYVRRLSKTIDCLPIIASKRILDECPDYKNNIVSIKGQFRSRNISDVNGEKHLSLFIFILDMEERPMAKFENLIQLRGFICKPPVYRTTPLGREIADVMLAVNRSYNKSDYIPCIFWGRNARYVSTMEVGQELVINGRVQSREYTKKSNNEEYTHDAYEISVTKIIED